MLALGRSEYGRLGFGEGNKEVTKEFALNMFLLKGTSDASKATVVKGVAGCTEVRKALFL